MISNVIESRVGTPDLKRWEAPEMKYVGTLTEIVQAGCVANGKTTVIADDQGIVCRKPRGQG